MRGSAIMVVGAALAVAVAGCGSSSKGDSADQHPDVSVTVASTTTTTRPVPTDPASRAVATYRAFVESEAAKLVTSTHQFTQAVIRGDVPVAKVLYPEARSHYESIEPIAERFGDLDKKIDARANDVSEFYFEGFHRIERQLFQAGNTTGMTPVASTLDFNVQVLQARIPGIVLSPASLAAGAVELLNEVATKKITGEEDRYSHTDLWDFEANLTGTRQAITALRPIYAPKAPALAAAIDREFASTQAALARYRKGDGYVLYTALTTNDTRTLSAEVNALADDISKIRPLVPSG